MASSSKGDPAPAGLFAFGATCFVLSCLTAGLPDIHRPPSDPVNVVTGMALFHGGLLQILVGVWEMFRNNTVSATIFTSYGAFWLSYATLLLPWFGVTGAYSALPDRVFGNSVGIFLVGWAIWTLLFVVVSLRSPLSMLLLFLSALLTFVLLAASSFVGAAQNLVLHRAAGVVGMLSAIAAVCNGVDLLLASMDPFPYWPWPTTKSIPQQKQDVSTTRASPV